MIVKSYREIDKDVWDAFVKSSNMNHSYFSYDMTSLPPPRNIRGKQYENASFGILDEHDELLLIFQLFKWSKKQNYWQRLLHKKAKINLASFHGMCVKNNLPNKKYKKLKETFETYMDTFWQEYKCKGLNIALPPFSDSLRPENKPQINPLIYYNFSPNLGYTYIIDLEKSENEIEGNYAPPQEA